MKMQQPRRRSSLSADTQKKGHFLWNAGRTVSNYLEEKAENLVTGKDVLEFGAGAGLPSLGYLWGSSPEKLARHLEHPSSGFDLLILADLLFNHSEHSKLISSVQQTLKRSPEARALVFFTPYRPWLLEKDLAFFDLARDAGFKVEKLLEHVMEKVMFENDRGESKGSPSPSSLHLLSFYDQDEVLRRTVYGYELQWTEHELRKEKI
ncbi:hypothetical protein FGG08_000770 [Glutinoglossum americanum]|uniref:Uncharacterized protein n=1 Tax=Glutinoglossum americanum TaxID=1670608 RepID=A0A9P8L0Y2_9PEZI|nr:hypothetical protein FGG08_000770 [Glutinoglossum americanum]